MKPSIEDHEGDDRPGRGQHRDVLDGIFIGILSLSEEHIDHLGLGRIEWLTELYKPYLLI